MDKSGEYTESIWVYWSSDVNRWNPENRAIVLDPSNCRWNVRYIGMPSVMKVGKLLALFYDAAPKEAGANMGRDVGLAWFDAAETLAIQVDQYRS